MAHQLSDHLQNAGILLVAAVVALAADRFAGDSARSGDATQGRARAGLDIGAFVTPVAVPVSAPPARIAVGSDPFGPPGIAVDTPADERSAPARGASRLTAILLADNRRVAVIDDATVAVGDVLRDGSRVSSIQANGVWLVERNGQWRMLTLTPQGQ